MRIIILIPEVKIKTDQEKITNNVWPMSGWIINRIDIIDIVTVVNKYLITMLLFSAQRIVVKKTIRKGFTTSMGWNLGKKKRSIHLFDPFTSTPIIGTNTKDIKEMKKNIIEYFINWSFFREENMKIINIPRLTYIKCLKKKK